MITAFRQPWLKDSVKPGMTVAAAGKVEFNYGFKRMTNPFIEEVGEGGALGMIIPVHGATEKMSAALIRRVVDNALDGAGRLRSASPRPSLQVPPHESSGGAFCVHFPQSMDEAREARRRLAYEELLLLELPS